MRVAPPSSAHATATMKANPGANTAPERLLRSRLHALGLRYRVNLRMTVSGVRTRPDIAFTRRRVAVFVDGCFWHGCPEHGSWPKSNAEFWREKIEGNARRDREQDEALREAGWDVIRVWEHEDVDDAVTRITAALGSRKSSRAGSRPEACSSSVLDARLAGERVECRHHQQH